MTGFCDLVHALPHGLRCVGFTPAGLSALLATISLISPACFLVSTFLGEPYAIL
jgi:hypothetical protein